MRIKLRSLTRYLALHEHSLPTHLPLLDHGSQLVSGEVHAVEVGEHITSLHLLCHQLEFAEGNLVVLQISQ